MKKLAALLIGFISLLFGLLLQPAHSFADNTYSLWANTTTPTVVSDPDSSAVELGTKFKSDVSGHVSAIKFYKGTSNTGTHVGHLWDNNGNLLATVTFANETSSGWQVATLTSPVAITANTTYVVSYHAPNGHYAADESYFNSDYNNAPLHAPATSTSGGNGVYKYGAAGQFPTDTYNASNYWVDVVFQPDTTPTPTNTPTPTPNTRKAILVVTSESNQFTKYYPEILKAEGLNEFDTADVSTVSASTLNNYDVVLLGEMSLTSTQVSTMTTWVNNGGNLIAMKPDKQLASLLGLNDAASTLADKYVSVNTSTGPGVGIVNQTIQYHSPADLYTLNGATAIATLYSDATTATNNPAVTTKAVGTNGGHAIAFTYDLAKSVVNTHQGNPAYAGQSLDGNSPPVRADNMFQQNYLDMNKVAIPQADEQQRLLANIITETNLDNKPLPRFWYLPKGLKAAIVYTLDDHNTASGTNDVFTKLANNSASGCSVADWECYRGTAWIYLGVPVSNTQAGTYNSQGFELGAHVENGCADFSSYANLDTSYANELQAFQTQFPSLPAQTTHRFHCIVWSDYLTQAKVERAHNIRYSMDYYYWPPAWVNGRPGLFTGSAIPMKFADTDGTVQDIYQGVSQLVNENGIAYDTDVFTLLNNATGANGYYGFFGTHDDYRDSTFSDSIINAAKAFNVPIITAKQALTWLDGRNNSIFTNFSWNGNTLTFNVTAATGSQNIQAMLPVNSTGNSISSLSLNGNPVTFTIQTIKGVNYAFFPATTGAYTAVYNGTISTPTPTPVPSATSLWNDTVTPNNPAANDTSAVEVGTKFTSDVAGQITGMKFYKGTGNTGVHEGHLWSSNGTLLASVTFANESAAGWQHATFSNPVNITANTTYVISYFAPNGHYAADLNYLTTNYDNAPLHAPASAGSGGNGVYSYGASGTFPTSTFNAANYWVDVVFQSNSTPTPTPTSTPVPTNTPTPIPAKSIWTTSVTPANPQVNDPNAVELGVKFTSDIAGQVKGIRFYKGTGNTGTHTGHLWDANGNALATVTFSNETASGWQEALFTTPVNIPANTTYIVSYYAPNGNYAGDNNYFGTAFDNAPLHAPASGTSGGNGVYVYGSDSFPTNTYLASNYWVDVIFQQ